MVRPHPRTTPTYTLVPSTTLFRSLGIGLGGDADRCLLVDADGNVVDGDQILYVIAQWKHANGDLRGPVVGTQMSNLGIERAFDALGKIGRAHVCTPVTNAHLVCRLLLEKQKRKHKPNTR